MSKNNQNSIQTANNEYSGPTLQELERLLNRIEELDAKREKGSVNSKQAA